MSHHAPPMDPTENGLEHVDYTFIRSRFRTWEREREYISVRQCRVTRWAACLMRPIGCLICEVLENTSMGTLSLRNKISPAAADKRKVSEDQVLSFPLPPRRGH